jgi:hypothetical protein
VPLPDPIPGLVLHYAYLWHDQHRRGLEEGAKDRPCVVVLSAQQEAEGVVVTVAPITHSPPRSPDQAVELPPATKRRLGLDADRSWVVVTEVNRFRWPGVDLRPVPGAAPVAYHYGVLPPELFRKVKAGIGRWARALRVKVTPR